VLGCPRGWVCSTEGVDLGAAHEWAGSRPERARSRLGRRNGGVLFLYLSPYFYSPVSYEAVVPAPLSFNGIRYSSEDVDLGTVDACSAARVAGYAQLKASTLAPRMSRLVPDQREHDHVWEGRMEVSCLHIYFPISTHRRVERISTSACFSSSTTFQAAPPCQRRLDHHLQDPVRVTLLFQSWVAFRVRRGRGGALRVARHATRRFPPTTTR
jgi:hypothetical protein